MSRPEAAPRESPERLQRLVEQLSDKNLQLRQKLHESARGISDLEAQVLRLHGEFPAADIERAVGRALDAECFSADGVRHLLLVQDDPSPTPVMRRSSSSLVGYERAMRRKVASLNTT